MTRMYYRGAKAAIVCYDVTDRSSLERARQWISQLQEAEPVSIVLSCCFCYIMVVSAWSWHNVHAYSAANTDQYTVTTLNVLSLTEQSILTL